MEARLATYLVGAQDILFTPDGPSLAEDLDDHASVSVVSRGRVETVEARIEADRKRVSGTWLLTPRGDLTVPDGSRIITRGGPAYGSELDQILREGRKPSLEMVAPSDLLAPPSVPDGRVRAHAEAVATLGPAIVLPAGAHESRFDEIEAMLEDADVAWSLREDDRWAAFLVESQPRSTSPGPLDFHSYADALMAATCWSGGAGGPSRTVAYSGRPVRHRLLGSLIASRQPFHVDWQPAFCPVEASVTVTDKGWSPFVAVTAARRESLEACALRIHALGRPHLVVGLAMLSAARPDEPSAG